MTVVLLGRSDSQNYFEMRAVLKVFRKYTSHFIKNKKSHGRYVNVFFFTTCASCFSILAETSLRWKRRFCFWNFNRSSIPSQSRVVRIMRFVNRPRRGEKCRNLSGSFVHFFFLSLADITVWNFKSPIQFSVISPLSILLSVIRLFVSFGDTDWLQRFITEFFNMLKVVSLTCRFSYPWLLFFFASIKFH